MSPPPEPERGREHEPRIRNTETGYITDDGRAMATTRGDDKEITVYLTDELAADLREGIDTGDFCSVPDAIEEAIARFIDDSAVGGADTVERSTKGGDGR
jgi:hypothetical protein